MNEFSPSGLQEITVPSTAINGTTVSLTVMITEDSIAENLEEIIIILIGGMQYRISDNASDRAYVLVEDNDGMYACIHTLRIKTDLNWALEIYRLMVDSHILFLQVCH